MSNYRAGKQIETESVSFSFLVLALFTKTSFKLIIVKGYSWKLYETVEALACGSRSYRICFSPNLSLVFFWLDGNMECFSSSNILWKYYVCLGWNWRKYWIKTNFGKILAQKANFVRSYEMRLFVPKFFGLSHLQPYTKIFASWMQLTHFCSSIAPSSYLICNQGGGVDWCWGRRIWNSEVAGSILLWPLSWRSACK